MIPSPLFRSATAFALILSLPVAAKADPTFDFYGQINFGLYNVDDGTETETFVTDNDNSNTRVGFWIRDSANSGAGLSFNFETALGFNGSSSATIDDDGADIDLQRTDLRKFEVIYETQRYGKFYFGQGGTSTDGVAEVDFSGTGVIHYVGIADLAGSFQFRPDGGDPSDITVGDAFKSFDGSRRLRLRYDTPEWNGLVLSLSGGEEVLNQDDENEYYDLGLKYGRTYGELKVGASVGYSWVSGGSETLMGSTSVLHEPSGVSFTVASGARQGSGDASFIYTKLGYQQNWFDFGRTFLAVDYNDGSDFEIDGSESTSVGLGVVQKVDAQNLEIYATYRTLEFDASGTDFEDIDVIAVGARWRF